MIEGNQYIQPDFLFMQKPKYMHTQKFIPSYTNRHLVLIKSYFILALLELSSNRRPCTMRGQLPVKISNLSINAV